MVVPALRGFGDYLPCRSQDDGEDAHGIFGPLLEYGYRERHRLPRACPTSTYDILAVQDFLYTPLLNPRRLGDSHSRERRNKPWCNIERSKACLFLYQRAIIEVPFALRKYGASWALCRCVADSGFDSRDRRGKDRWCVAAVTG